MKLNTALAVLQQSEYYWPEFASWYEANREQAVAIKPQKWTGKLRILKSLGQMMFFLPLTTRLRLSLMLFAFFEWPIKQTMMVRAKAKLRRLQKNGLQVVAIAGSYGKTSVKHIAFHLLKRQVAAITTPKSVNTPLGISQVVLNKLTDQHRLFIVELGEYYPGDIRLLTKFVQPDWGILTPIGKQHLSRMKSMANVVSTMGELLDFFQGKPDQVIIADLNRQHYGQKWHYYGTDHNSAYRVSEVKVDRQGTNFKLITPDTSCSAFSPLYGEHQAVNSLPAAWLSDQLGLDVSLLCKQMTSLPYVKRRHEPTFGVRNLFVLDNSYNTNPDSMRVSLDLINQLEASNRIIITLGYLELGDDNDQEHYELGKLLAQKVDYVGLVKSRWNSQIEAGWLDAGGKKEALRVASNPDRALELLNDIIVADSLILLEGGYQEIFT